MNEKPVHRVVIVEDSTDDYLLLERAIRKSGLPCEILWIQDGEKAMDYFKSIAANERPVEKGFPALVLLDSMLPKRGGLEILQFIRSQDRLEGLPVVKLFTEPSPTAIEDATHLGATWSLPKSALFGEVERFFRFLAKKEDEPHTG